MATLIQFPSTYNMAYGPNIITAVGIGTDARYVIQLWDGPPATGGSALLATLKQSPNANDRAIFDIQNVLQSYVGVSQKDIDELGTVINPEMLNISDLETFKFYVRFGTESASGVITWDGSAGPYYSINGYQPFWDSTWNWNPYSGLVSGESETIANCTVIHEVALPLSDWTGEESDYKTAAQVTAMGLGVYAKIAAAPYNTYDVHYVSNEDYRSKSWLNLVRLTNPAPEPEVKGIEAFRIVVFNGASIIQNAVVGNRTQNNGGPNTFIGEGLTVDYPYRAITMGTGPANLANFSYWADQTVGPAYNFQLDSNWTHYYVYPTVWTNETCGPNFMSYISDEALGRPQLYIRKDAECLDYGTNSDLIQFSWLNSLGFRDYFTFRKRNERSVNISRNTYTASTYDPDAASWSSDPAARGDKTYSQELEEEWVATTGYITDKEAKHLQHLFTSADVRVKLPSQWYQRAGITYEPFIAAVVTSNTYIERTFRKDRLFQYEIRFKLANNIKSQRG